MEKTEVLLVSKELWDDMQHRWSALNNKVDLLLEQQNNGNASNDDTLLSIKETAQFLGVNQATIHEWKWNGSLPFKRIGGRVYILKSDLLKRQ